MRITTRLATSFVATFIGSAAVAHAQQRDPAAIIARIEAAQVPNRQGYFPCPPTDGISRVSPSKPT